MSENYPKRYDLDGTPVLVKTNRSVPQALGKDGQWRPFVDMERLHTEAVPITDEGEWQTLLKERAKA
jgi:hypothetical protein